MSDLKKVDRILDSMDKFIEDSSSIPGKLDDIVNRLSKLERCNRTSEQVVHNFNVKESPWVPIIKVGVDGDNNGLFCINIKSTSQGWEYLIDIAMCLNEETPIRILSVKENHTSTQHDSLSTVCIDELNMDMISFRLLQNEDSCGGTIVLNIPDVDQSMDSVSVCIVDGPLNMDVIQPGSDPNTLADGSKWSGESQYTFSVVKNNIMTYWYGIESLKNLTLVSHEMTSCIPDNTIPLNQIQRVVFTIYDNETDLFTSISERHKSARDILTGNILLNREDMCTINYTVTELDGSIVVMMMATLGDYSYNSNRFELHKVEFNLYRGINNEHRT